ncbi:hypothetical protein MTO96_022210 [Rhipicephalus appendiculatus]
MDGARAEGGVDRSKLRSSSPNVSSRIQERQRKNSEEREVRLTKHTDHINTFRRGVTAVPMALQSDGEDFDEETSLRETPHVKKAVMLPSRSPLLQWSVLKLSTPSRFSTTVEQRLRRRHGRGQAALTWPWDARTKNNNPLGARGCRRTSARLRRYTHAAADGVRHRGSAASLERRLRTRSFSVFGLSALGSEKSNRGSPSEREGGRKKSSQADVEEERGRRSRVLLLAGCRPPLGLGLRVSSSPPCSLFKPTVLLLPISPLPPFSPLRVSLRPSVLSPRESSLGDGAGEAYPMALLAASLVGGHWLPPGRAGEGRRQHLLIQFEQFFPGNACARNGASCRERVGGCGGVPLSGAPLS